MSWIHYAFQNGYFKFIKRLWNKVSLQHIVFVHMDHNHKLHPIIIFLMSRGSHLAILAFWKCGTLDLCFGICNPDLNLHLKS